MEQLRELIQSDGSCEQNECEINTLLDETYVQKLSDEEYSRIVDYCLRFVASSSCSSDFKKQLTVKILKRLHLFRKNDFNEITLQVVKELFSSDSNQPEEILLTSNNLLTINFVEDIVSSELSDNLLRILLRLRGKLSLGILVDISNVTRLYPKCLPPQHQHHLFCSETINQVSSVTVPNLQIVNFMQDVMNIASMVQRIWLTSPGDIVLHCLANIYTLIAESNESSPPSRSLAAFLNVTPKSQIALALEKLLILAGLSKSDDHVIKLAMVLCDWLWLWPKATQLSCWILSLFKILTLDGRSAIVAEVISAKAPKLMEQSIIPVMRVSTAPVLPYLLITLRDQPYEMITPVLKPAIKLINVMKAQQTKDPTSQTLILDLIDAVYILNERRPRTNEDDSHIGQILSEYPRPNEQRLSSKLSAIPSLFDRDVSRISNQLIMPQHDWLDARTPTGKIGLINLGNTCYVNSILQALYMNSDFTRAVLGSMSTNHHHLLVQLQKVLIFLQYSFRSAYSPAAFIRASRPPWFEAGRQQDCSEFLRYLMDSLYEQERVSRNVLQCGQRWTVGASKENETAVDVEPNAVKCDNESENANGELQRWVTEEDLSVGVSSENLTSEASLQVAESLSNVHSDSTDSGIQSVGDGQEEKINKSIQSASEPADKQHRTESEQQLSLVHQIFGGKMTTTYRCLACGTESHHQDFFTDLHLAFPDAAATTPVAQRVTRQVIPQTGENLDLDSLLEFYFTAEKLQGENRYHCDHCAKLVQEAERILRVTEAPQHLLLTLLRFHYDRLLQRRGKITTQVNYPLLLNLPVDGGVTVSYALYAVVIHSGVTLDGGHYYTLARNSSDLNASGASGSTPWFMFNDSQVSRTDFESLISLSRKYPTDTPYLLWYRKVNDGAVESGCPGSVSVPPILPTDLKRLVDDDNAKFVREKLQTINRSVRTNWTPPKKDDDEDNYRGDTFHDNNGSRFIF